MIEFMRPRFEGDVELTALPADFPARVADRVDQGLLRKGSRRRANYRVVDRNESSVSFRAEDWSTGINLGLNEVWIERVGPGCLHYRVLFPVWARYVRVLSATICAVLGLSALLPALREEIASYPAGQLLFWGMVVFWGVVWPQILVGLHKSAAARFLERMLREELAT